MGFSIMKHNVAKQNQNKTLSRENRTKPVVLGVAFIEKKVINGCETMRMADIYEQYEKIKLEVVG